MKREGALELAYPLHWPVGKPRRKYPERSRFATWTFARARDELLSELKLLGVKYIVISSNVPTRLDGLPYSGMREPEDSGVAVYFDLKGEQRVMCCDRWSRATDNLHALALTIQAMRGISRWGSEEMVTAAFAGFKALPPSADDWRSVFGFDRTLPQPTFLAVKERYRKRALDVHPDRGGSHADMVKLNAALFAAEKELGS